MKFKLIALFAITISVLGASFVLAQNDLGVYANHPAVIDLKEKIDAKEQELKTLDKSTALYTQKIEEARSLAKSLQSQLLLIDNQTTKAELDIKTTELAMDKNKLEIESAQYQADQAGKDIEAQKGQLMEYLKLIHKEDQKSVLEVLIVNESFSEFFNQVNYIEGVQNDLKNSIDRVELLKNVLELKKADLSNFQIQLEQNKKQLSENRSHLKEQQTAKEVVLLQSKHSETKYLRLLDEAKSVQDEVDNSILTIKDEIKKKIERLRTGGTDPKTTFLFWPVSNAYGITTYFNDPGYPFRYLFEHSALDIRQPQGSNVVAPADAYVARARDNGYGYSYITLVHDNGLSTVYGHVSKILVRPDQFVKAGEIIALSGGRPGSRGAGNLTTGPHLHFEVRLNGIPVDPLIYLP